MNTYHELMKSSNDKPLRRVSEPVQVYLDSRERARLESLAAQLGATKSDVLRRGLEALEQQSNDPNSHPALRLIGLSGSSDRPSAFDSAREHDRALVEGEIESWQPKKVTRRRGR